MSSKYPVVVVDKTPSSSIFEVTGVSKWFISPDKKEKTYAVRDATLSITRGAITGIVGESGSGKTTLLYLLGGLYKPNKGEVSYCSRNQGLVFEQSWESGRC